MEHPFLMFLDHTQRRSTVGRTPLDKGSVHRRGHCLHNKHNRRTSRPSVGFEPAVPPIKLLQTYVLKCTTTGNGLNVFPLQITHLMSENPIPKTLCLYKLQCRIGQERLTKTSTSFVTTMTMMMLTAEIADCRDMQYVV